MRSLAVETSDRRESLRRRDPGRCGIVAVGRRTGGRNGRVGWHSGGRRLTPPRRKGVTTTKGVSSMQFLKTTAAVLGALVLGSVSTASAATPTKLYWTEEHAEAIALAQVRVRDCLLIQDGVCRNGSDGRPHHWTFHLNGIACTGADEKGDTFTFSRFKCRFTTGYAEVAADRRSAVPRLGREVALEVVATAATFMRRGFQRPRVRRLRRPTTQATSIGSCS